MGSVDGSDAPVASAPVRQRRGAHGPAERGSAADSGSRSGSHGCTDGEISSAAALRRNEGQDLQELGLRSRTGVSKPGDAVPVPDDARTLRGPNDRLVQKAARSVRRAPSPDPRPTIESGAMAFGYPIISSPCFWSRKYCRVAPTSSHTVRVSVQATSLIRLPEKRCTPGIGGRLESAMVPRRPPLR